MGEDELGVKIYEILKELILRERKERLSAMIISIKHVRKLT